MKAFIHYNQDRQRNNLRPFTVVWEDERGQEYRKHFPLRNCAERFMSVISAGVGA